MSVAYLADKHQQIEWVGGKVMELLLDADATEGKLFMSRAKLAAGDAVPVHVHSQEDEVFLLLAGSASFWFGAERFEAGPESVVYLPRDVPHAYRITTDSDLLTICTPAGAERFFRTGHDLAQPKPDNWALTPMAVAEAAAASGVRIIGPPPTE